MEIGHKLTENIIDFINTVLVGDETYFRVKWNGNTGHIILANDVYFDQDINQSIRPNQKFYERLESLLKTEFGLTSVGYNNTMTTFWCIQ